MPTYKYKCNTCDLTITVIQRMADATYTPICVNCSKELVREYESPAITFKGTGWGKD